MSHDQQQQYSNLESVNMRIMMSSCRILLVVGFHLAVTVSVISATYFPPLHPNLHNQSELVSGVGNNIAGTEDGKSTKISPIKVPLVNNIHSNIQGVEKCGSISIGTPAKTFTAAFVDDISDVFVDSVECNCKYNHTRYDHMHSSSYAPNGKTFSIANNTHLTASGYLSNDVITVADVPVKIPFGEITQEQDIPFTVSACDGIVGLGYRNGGLAATILSELVNKSLIPEPVFGLHLNRDPKAEDGGELSLGGTNTQFYDGDIHYVNLTRNNAWEFRIHGLSVPGEKSTLCGNGCNATMGTVDPFIIGNFEEIEKLNKQLGAKSPAFGIFIFNCSALKSLPLVSFLIDGYELVLSGEDYVYKTVDPPACFSRFQGVIEQPKDKLLLGNVLVGPYYAVFDAGKRRIGFVKDRL